MSSQLDQVAAGLLAERYAPSVWWPKPPSDAAPLIVSPDTPENQAARRRLLEAADARMREEGL